MRAELKYESKIFGECPSDYDFSSIKDEKELKFLKWMNVLQATITRLKYNIELFVYFSGLYLLKNDVVKNKFKCFFTVLLSNISAILSIDFSCLLSENNELNIDQLKSFCNSNPSLFKYESISKVLKSTRALTSKAKESYKKYLHDARRKIFAHIDEIILDDNKAKNIVDNVSSQMMKELLKNIIDIINPIWTAYNNQKLCFVLENWTDYKELTKILCIQFGETRFE